MLRRGNKRTNQNQNQNDNSSPQLRNNKPLPGGGQGGGQGEVYGNQNYNSSNPQIHQAASGVGGSNSNSPYGHHVHHQHQQSYNQFSSNPNLLLDSIPQGSIPINQQSSSANGGGMRSSTSQDAMPPPSSNQSNNNLNNLPYSSINSTASLSDLNSHQSAPISRGHSAFNFLLSKAKNPFSTQSQSSSAATASSPPPSHSNSISTGMNVSNSNHSISSQHGGGGGSKNAEDWSSQQSSQEIAGGGAYSRSGSIQSNLHNQQAGYQNYHYSNQSNNIGQGFPSSSSTSFGGRRPSVGTAEDYSTIQVSSPTKRGFFSNISGRDRKLSNTGNVVNPKMGPPSPSGLGLGGAGGNLGGKGSSSSASASGVGGLIGFGNNAKQREGSNHSGSIVGVGRGGGGSSPFNPNFSKSQNDLHSNPSPSSGSSNDLPPVPSLNQSGGGGGEQYLKSPSSNIGFSRSVDDLNAGSQNAASLGGASPILRAHKVRGGNQNQNQRYQSSTSNNSGSGNSGQRSFGSGGRSAGNQFQQQQQAQGNWGEYGFVSSNSDWRPSDMGAISSSTSNRERQTSNSSNNSNNQNQSNFRSTGGSRAGSNGSNSNNQNPHSRSESLLSNVPIYQQPQPSVPPIPNQHLQAPESSRNHQRKGSKVSSSSTSGQGSNVMPALPPNSIHQGFLSRNSNISLTLNQLNNSNSYVSSGNNGEKDISKGWKPYRVILEKDGKLLFYKPGTGGNVAEEVKSLFPTGLVRNEKDSKDSSNSTAQNYAKDLGIDVESIRKGGLGTQDLLMATSSGSNPGSSKPIPPPLPHSKNSNPNFNLPASSSSSSSVNQKSSNPPLSAGTDPQSTIQVESEDQSELISSTENPGLVVNRMEKGKASSTWGDRIQNGSLKSLAYEFVRNDQFEFIGLDKKETLKQVDSFLFPLLFSLLRLKNLGSGLKNFVSELEKEISNLIYGKEESEKEEIEVEKSKTLDLQLIKIKMERFLEIIPVLMVEVQDRSEIVEDLEKVIRKLWNEKEGESEEVSNIVSTKLSSLWEIPPFSDKEASLSTPKDWRQEEGGSNEDPSRSNNEILSELSQGRISDQTLLKLEPVEVAQQIQVFHSERFRTLVCPRLSASRFTQKGKGSGEEVGNDNVETETSSPKLPSDSLSSLFSYDSTSPHFLTKLILDQIFSPDSEVSSRSRLMNNNQFQSPPYRRAAIIRHWVRISTLLLSLNDLNGWLAITTALCSRSISRLESTWRLVPQTDRVLIGKVWAPQLAKLGWVDGLKSSVKPLMMNIFSSSSSSNNTDPEASRNKSQLATIPYFGDLSPTILREMALSGNSTSNEDTLEISGFKESSEKLFLALKTWSSEWSAGKNELEESSIPSVVTAKREYQLAFQLLAESSSSEVGASSGTGQYLQASLKVEPKSLGNVDLRWKLPQPEKIALNSLVPLKFSEALPHLHLLPRKDSNPSNSGRSPNLKGIEDSESTIMARSHNRPALNSPSLAKSSKPFSNNPSSRNISKEIAFSSVSEFGNFSNQSSTPFNNSTISSLNSPSLSPSIRTNVVEEESIIKIGNELVLKVKAENAGSNPSSPRASRRLSSDMASITRSRPVSQISKRSSLPASNRNSVIEIGTPMQVTVKAATLERLVDVLVMGVSHLVASLSQDSNDGTLSPTRRIKLSIDLEAYRSCFLATFRSLCSPIVLFEFLRKRFVAAENASRELSLPEQYRSPSQFPSWSMMPSASSQADPIDTEIVTRIRLGVIDVLKIWVKRFSQDFADDSDLFEGIHSFLKQTSTILQTEQEEINRVNSSRRTSGVQGEEDSLSERIKVFSALEDLDRALRIGVLAVNNGKEIGKRKHQTSKSNEQSSNPSSTPSSTSSTIDLDSSSPAELLDYLEVVSAIFFDKVHEHDLLIATEVFENQASDPLGWFSAKFGPSRNHGEDEIPTLSMYKLLEIIRPIKKDAKSLLGRLPVALIDVCAAQNLIVGWLTLQIVEPKIGLARRQARIEKLVDAVWLCRARMLRLRQEDQSSFSPDAASPFKEATIASFLECAITSSLTTNESRGFIRAWQGVASLRNASGDNLADLLPPGQTVSSLKDTVSTVATPDVGWILSCLAEVVSKPSDLDSSDSTLINFDKCRSVWNLIDSAMRFRPFDPTTMELANVRLKTLQHQLSRFIWDQRAMREDAAQEASSSPLPSSNRSRSYRPLTLHLGAQQDKKRNDRTAFDLIESELRPSHHNNARAALEGTGQPSQGSSSRSTASKLLSSNVSSSQPAAPLVPPTQAEKKTRRMTALFRGAVRPMGLMTEKVEKEKVEVPSRSYGELLALTPLHKPGLVAGCAGAHVAVWGNSQRSYVFHLTSQEGHKYLLQAPSQGEMVEWCSHIEKMAKELTVTSKKNDGKKSSSNQKGKVVVQPLYGVDLQVLVEREGRDIPVGLERMLAEVEARGLREQGIYRISGAKSAIQTLKETFGREPPESIDLSTGEFSDVHTISGAIKQWFRDLPEPPVPFNCYHTLIDAERIESHDDRLYAIKDLIWTFPKAHFDLLRRVAEHLARVVDEGATNLMQAHNLGLIFGTFLLNPPPGPSAVAESFGNIGKAAHVVKIILTHNEWLFEPEAEVEPEAETTTTTEAKVNPEAEQDVSKASLLGTPQVEEDANSSVAPSPVSKDIPLPESDPIPAAQAPAPAQENLHPSDSEVETASEGRTPAHEFSQEELDNLVELRSNPVDTSPSSLKTIPVPASITEMMRSDSSQSDSSLPPAAVGGSDISANSLSPTPRLRVRDVNSNSRGREESVYLDATESLATLQAFEFQSPARSSLPPQDKEEVDGLEEVEGDEVQAEEEDEQNPLDQTITIESKEATN